MMKKTTLFFLLIALLFTATSTALAQSAGQPVRMQIFDEVLFYDGYNSTIFDSALNDGVLRHSNSLYAVKLTEEQLSKIGEWVTIDITVKASCDNYDRIANIGLALVPKGDTTYNINDVQRIEIGRFITPFMNKNAALDTVPYWFNASYLQYILRDSTLNANYDFWFELGIFGVPYAANTQIAGCAGRNDVFYGSVWINSSEPACPISTGNCLIPMDFQFYLYKYNEDHTDTLGKTTKTYTIDVPEDMTDAKFIFITSNHGANSGGEEYNRRWHYVYIDNELALTYKPGRTSCEPFRVYNTQGNGIYGTSRKTDASWQSFSNWCPGDVIDTRVIDLGAFEAGQHTFRLSVPDAVFNNNEGYFPVSVFFLGKSNGVISSLQAIEVLETTTSAIYNSANDVIEVKANDTFVKTATLISMNGQELMTAGRGEMLPMHSFNAGIYLVRIECTNGLIEVHKVAVGK
ncbi:MAG: peptide-N-glycosidase F-related protein [Bacteroidales bacterium]|nr:peptide-N-glycosidase F-related protein [Bacteroidales bacterium]